MLEYGGVCLQSQNCRGRRQQSGVRSQELGVRSQESGVRSHQESSGVIRNGEAGGRRQGKQEEAGGSRRKQEAEGRREKEAGRCL